ncbi:MAG: S8 family serine peptidase, partial [Candidatus Omnitrophica bacterium]|nr:S8 family serine peptidase [Candidatus Omnitrophota bacterium]
MRKLFFFTGIMGILFISSSAWAMIEGLELISYRKESERVIVGFREETTEAEILKFLEKYHCQLMGPISEFRVYGIILPQGLTYQDVVEKFLEEDCIRYVLPDYPMAQQQDASKAILTDVKAKNNAVLEQIRLIQALTWIADLERKGLLGRKGILVATADLSGLHPELTASLKTLGMWGGVLKWDAQANKFVYSTEDTSMLPDAHNMAVTTLIAGILSEVKAGITIMPLFYDGSFATYIEGIKQAIERAKIEGKRLIINSSFTLNPESYNRAEIDVSLRYYYVGMEIENLRKTMSDIEIYIRWEQIIQPLIDKASSLFSAINQAVKNREIRNYSAWGETDYQFLKNKFSLSEAEINVLKYALQAAKQKFLLFTKSPLAEDFKQFSQEALIVASAGNFHNESANFPAFYPSVIGVGASDSKGYLGDSNFGEWVNVYVPGGYDRGIWTQWIRDGRLTEEYVKGTSFSAPLISALGALLFKTDSTLSTEEIRMIIEGSSKRIYSSEIKRYINFGDALTAVKVGFIYGGIKSIVSSLKEYFDKIKTLSTQEISVLRGEIKNRILTTLGEKVFREDKTIFNNGYFSSLLDNIMQAGNNFNSARNSLLLELSKVQSQNINLATGIFISGQLDTTLSKEALKLKAVNLSLSEVELDNILKYAGEDFLRATELANLQKSLKDLFSNLEKVRPGRITEADFLRLVESALGGRRELYDLYKNSFSGFFNELKQGKISLGEAKGKIVYKIWEIGEIHKEENLSETALLVIDSLKLSSILSEIIKTKEPILESNEAIFIMSQGGTAKDILAIASVYAGIKGIYQAIDKFNSPWPKDWVSLLVPQTNFISAFTFYITKAKYMSSYSISSPIEKFCTEVLENFIKIFSGQTSLSKKVTEFDIHNSANNLLNQILWQLVTREVDKETAKRKLLDLIKNESKLEQIDIALDLFTQYYA